MNNPTTHPTNTTPNTTTVRVTAAVAVNDTLVRAGVRHLLSHCSSVSAVMDVTHGTAPLNAVRSLRPDVLVLGMDRPASQQLPMLVELCGLTRVIALSGSRDAALAALAARGTLARVLVHGEFAQDDFVRSVAAAARNRLTGQAVEPKISVVPYERVSNPPVGSAVPLGSAGFRLSARESDVMRCVANGMRNTEIAVALTLTQKTVKNYINRIFAKLGVETRTQALLIWLEAAAA